MVEHTFSGAVFFLSKILVVMIVKYDFIKFNSVKSIAEPAFNMINKTIYPIIYGASFSKLVLCCARTVHRIASCFMFSFVC